MMPSARTPFRTLAAALVLTLGLVLSVAAFAAPASAATADDELRLYELTNASRAQNGKGPLAYDAAASGVARAWAEELARSGNLRHNPNLVAQVDAHVTNQWTTLGENVGWAGTIDQVHNAYMNSPGHRANILGNYNRVGVGSATANGRVWTTVVFLQGPALPVVSPNAFAPFTSASAFVTQQYSDFLGRTPDPGGLSSWSAALMSNQTNTVGVVAAFLNSGEFGGRIAPVARLYLAYFGRNPDVNGLFYWADQLRRGASLANVSEAFAASTEFRTRYGSLNDTQFVDLVYRNVLGRTPDAGGLNYWVGRLAAGALNRGGVMTGFSESGEYRNATNARVTVVSAYLGLLRRSPDSGGQSYWEGVVRNGGGLGGLLGGLLGSAEYRSRFA